MTLTQLDNLVRAGQIHIEPPDQKEFDGLLRTADERIRDAKNSTLSLVSRFDLIYNAAHALALAALRRHGYRTDKRYLVFQCLGHTVNLEQAKVRVLVLCHDRRNKTLYEGLFEIEDQLLEELLDIVEELRLLIQKPGPLPTIR